MHSSVNSPGPSLQYGIRDGRIMAGLAKLTHKLQTALDLRQIDMSLFKDTFYLLSASGIPSNLKTIQLKAEDREELRTISDSFKQINPSESKPSYRIEVHVPESMKEELQDTTDLSLLGNLDIKYPDPAPTTQRPLTLFEVYRYKSNLPNP